MQVNSSMGISQDLAWAEHEQFWREFWQRSYVTVGQGPPGSSSDQLNLMHVLSLDLCGFCCVGV
jgi:hypothetical protein